MSFLHPWAIAAGAAAIALPFIIHWLTRPRPMRIPLSTIRFVKEVVEQRRARYRLRDFLILLLRAVAILLLAWAFARPLLGTKPPIAADENVDAIRVVILDQSQSMAAAVHGISPFERARTTAAKYLSYQSGLQGNLILAAAQPRPVFDRLSSNFAVLKDQLSSASALPERLNLQPAIRMAGELLSQVPDGSSRRRELIIVSDFQRSNWASADFSALPKETIIQLESVTPQNPRDNLAILRVGTQGRMEQGREVKLEVEVGNYASSARNVDVEVAIGDTTYQLKGLCPAGVSTTLTSDITLQQSGWQAGSARLMGIEDTLAADNSRSFALDVRPMPVYALITRESSKPHRSSSHYLERALAPIKGKEGQQAERVVRIHPSKIDREALAAANLFVLDRPGPLSMENINLLSGLLRRGRGMLYVASEPADATNLKRIEESAGADLKMPVELAPPESGQSRRGLFLAEWKNESPFIHLGDNLPAALAPLRFAGGLSTRRAERGLIDDVLATYSDRSACLVATACGAGSLVILNADLAESNIVQSPIFVPLVGELVGRLLAQRRADDAAASGEPLALYLPPDAGASEGLRIEGPQTSSTDKGELTEEGGFLLWRWGAMGPPGLYEIKRDAATVFAAASAIPALESDLRSIEPSTLTTRLAGGRSIHYQAASDEQKAKDDTWAWILVVCSACLLFELATLKAFRT